ncbi:hypothetical protein ACHAXA_006605, partial [Cyclostephanos tholiformis]
ESPTVVVPRLVAVRAYCAIVCARRYAVSIPSSSAGMVGGGGGWRFRDAEEVRLIVRDRLRSSLRMSILGLLMPHTTPKDGDEDEGVDDDDDGNGEEAGRLGVHVLCLPPPHRTSSSSTSTSTSTSTSSGRKTMPIPPSLVSYMSRNIVDILRQHRRTMYPKKRFRGNDPTSKQGGDPRTNLELRTRRSLGQIVLRGRIDVDRGVGEGDVKNNKRQEEICSKLALIGCGGIAHGNNERIPTTIDGCNYDRRHTDDGRGNVVYGMCKFHASGREDMDVRMLLPPPSRATITAESNMSVTTVTGRPFVCEVIDALRMPSRSDLERVADAINCIRGSQGGVGIRAKCNHRSEVTGDNIEWDERGWPRTLVKPNRYHGCNPRGVGVSTPLVLVPSSAFYSLQLQTEEKVKCYGCVCWTSVAIVSDMDLVQKLGCKSWDMGEDDADKAADFSNKFNYPLEIHQVTPLRVLHRRSSNVRVRCILNLSACRISDHWFRLRMSTSAGTYVKEFVHGDCGRTYPSIALMLGGRTDITELDCEGIIIKDSVHVVLWQHLFYIMGTYTKSRLDVFQMPFYITCRITMITTMDMSMRTANNEEDGSNNPTKGAKEGQCNSMVRLGILSVEEEKCLKLVLIGCGGTAHGNKEHILMTIDIDGSDYNR